MSTDLILSHEFATARTSKAGKTVYRGALGVVTSGNKAEREQLAGAMLEGLLKHNNYRHAMRELDRVFPVSVLSKASNVLTQKNKETGETELSFIEQVQADDGAGNVRNVEVIERYHGWNQANKGVFRQFAFAVRQVARMAEAAGKPLKGERMYYAGRLSSWLDEQAVMDELKALEAGIPDADPAGSVDELVFPPIEA